MLLKSLPFLLQTIPLAVQVLQRRSCVSYILSRVLVTETGFELAIGFINYLRVVTVINYNTVINFHSKNTRRKSSESIPTCLHYPFPGKGSQHKYYHRLALQISLYQVSLNCN
jgi:hypothetical protein